MSRVGIIGGLGPLASSNFYTQLILNTPAESDQEHISTVLISDSTIPGRIEHLSGSGDSPLPALQAVLQQLQSLDCSLIALPSITTHAYYIGLGGASSGIVNMVDTITEKLCDAGLSSIAIAMTTPAREMGILPAALSRAGIDVLLPDPKKQEQIHGLVTGVKSGADLQSLGMGLEEAISAKWSDAADAYLIGCTDLSPLYPLINVNKNVYDVTNIYANAIISRLMKN